MGAVEVRGRRTDGTGRWFLLRFELRPKRSGSLVSYATGFSFDIQPADKMSATYLLQNWESGIVSGIGFALRRTPDRDWGLELSAMEGTLGSSDMTALAHAATIAAFRLHEMQSPPPADSEWEFETRDVATLSLADVGHVGTPQTPPLVSVT
jgi:hypothetical protein